MLGAGGICGARGAGEDGVHGGASLHAERVQRQERGGGSGGVGRHAVRAAG